MLICLLSLKNHLTVCGNRIIIMVRTVP
jgi:hypothetical protein